MIASTWQCPRCGSHTTTLVVTCRLCRRPKDAPKGWEIPEHDAPRRGVTVAEALAMAEYVKEHGVHLSEPEYRALVEGSWELPQTSPQTPPGFNSREYTKPKD